MKEIRIICFPHSQISVSLVSFVYLSLLSLPMLLFEIFNFRFHVIIDWLFLTCFFTTLAIRHNARVWSVQKLCLYIQNIYLFFSFQVPQRLRYDFPGLLLDCLQRSSSWLKILMVEKLIVKKLSTLDGLYDNSLLMGAPHHMAILPG